MHKNRLEAFSDGVIAIIITIMVLELQAPEGGEWQELRPLIPHFLGYVLSFLYLGIYWNNHHHLIHTVQRVTGGILWANLHLLFWLSLMPFATAWVGETRAAPIPTAVYGAVLLMSGVGYYVLQLSIIAVHGHESLLALAIGRDFKGKSSMVAYLLALLVALYVPNVGPRVANTVYAMVALMWIVPDRRIERILNGKS